MGYLAIDTEQAASLAAELHAAAAIADRAHTLVLEASVAADLPLPCVLELDDSAADLDLLARRIEQAVVTVNRFVLTRAQLTAESFVPEPTRTPVPSIDVGLPAAPLDTAHVPAPAQWVAAPDTPWNGVVQAASHNSFAVVGGIDALLDHGVRAFELDIHRRPPHHVRLTGSGSAGDTTEIDWQVYHVLGWSHREYQSLREGLAAVAAAPVAEPVTVFVDNKDGFGGVHTAQAFDRVLRDELGGRLFTPGDLLVSVPNATSLLDAVDHGGWPTVSELEGRVMVVLTDDTNGYRGDERLAFVSVAPHFVTHQDQIVHVPEPGVVFYNANARTVGPSEIQAVNATNTVLRTYFNPPCPEHVLGHERVEANYRAVDIGANGSVCELRVIVPPTPVPGPG